eukprot:g8933.t1
MDGGHLKGRWNGVMLTLSCKDANNAIIHVATTIGPKENAELYQQLLQTCKKNQQMKKFLEDSKTTYFTDGHKGLPAALKSEAKDAQHRLCLKHTIGNISEKIGSEANSWLFHAARAATTAQCDSLLERKVKNTNCVKHVHRDSYWSVLRNCVQDRKEALPDLTRRILEADAQRYATRAELGKDGDKWTPFAAKMFEDQREKSKGLLPVATGKGYYNVNSTIATQTTRGNRVRLTFSGPGEDNQWTCTCNLPARFLIPC